MPNKIGVLRMARCKCGRWKSSNWKRRTFPELSKEKSSEQSIYEGSKDLLMNCVNRGEVSASLGS